MKKNGVEELDNILVKEERKAEKGKLKEQLREQLMKDSNAAIVKDKFSSNSNLKRLALTLLTIMKAVHIFLEN